MAATLAMSQGARNWPLLDVDRCAGFAGGQQQVGLAAQEGGDLEDVAGLGRGRAVVGRVHIGQHRAADARADLGEDIEPGRPFRRRVGPTGLVRFALS